MTTSTYGRYDQISNYLADCQKSEKKSLDRLFLLLFEFGLYLTSENTILVMAALEHQALILVFIVPILEHWALTITISFTF